MPSEALPDPACFLVEFRLARTGPDNYRLAEDALLLCERSLAIALGAVGVAKTSYCGHASVNLALRVCDGAAFTGQPTARDLTYMHKWPHRARGADSRGSAGGVLGSEAMREEDQLSFMTWKLRAAGAPPQRSALPQVLPPAMGKS